MDNIGATLSPFSFCFLNQNPQIPGRARAGSHRLQGTDPEATCLPCSLAYPALRTHLLLPGKAPLVPTLPSALALPEYSTSSPSCGLSLPIFSSGPLFECHLLTKTLLATPKLFAPTHDPLTHRLATRATHSSHLGHFKITDAQRLALLLWVNPGISGTESSLGYGSSSHVTLSVSPCLFTVCV